VQDAVADQREGRRLLGRLEQTDVHLERGERLPEVVVQFARDAGALLLLHREQSLLTALYAAIRLLAAIDHLIESVGHGHDFARASGVFTRA
jgi:hypothetical protein